MYTGEVYSAERKINLTWGDETPRTPTPQNEKTQDRMCAAAGGRGGRWARRQVGTGASDWKSPKVPTAPSLIEKDD